MEMAALRKFESHEKLRDASLRAITKAPVDSRFDRASFEQVRNVDKLVWKLCRHCGWLPRHR